MDSLNGRRPLGLALSGGGALGAAHIGVLEELESHFIDVDLLSGTSVGAIIGALFADQGLESVYGFLKDMEKAGITNRVRGILTRTPARLFSELSDILKKHLTARRFEDLKKPFICVATDITTGDMFLMDSGELVPAVLSSSAYPGVFPIQHVRSKLLVDGGLTRNLPADVLRNYGAKFVIGSSLYCVSRVSFEERRIPLGRLQTMLRSVEIMERELSRRQILECDFCFTPPIQPFKWYDFDHVDAIQKVGRTNAKRQIDDLVKVLEIHSSDSQAEHLSLEERNG